MLGLGSASFSVCFTSTKGTGGVGSKDRGQEDLLKYFSLLCDRLLHEVFRGAAQPPQIWICLPAFLGQVITL